ncbi:MAG: adenylate/guanylate cyclase domain-containing protein [Gammaproteobacteria bacterium]|nr:adenylate/guanylate cyclase domain-containing protein [Gammaproteobacteria bacterium]
MEPNSVERKLAAILYADVAGYSRLTGEDEDATHSALGESLDLIAGTVSSCRGTVMHYAGDAVLARFESTVDALGCAARIQELLAQRNEPLPAERRMHFRIGINLGDVIIDRGDIYGEGVNVAARLESLADPGGICISESVRTAVGNRLPYTYQSLGRQRVKNIAEPVSAYRVVLDPAAADRRVRLKRSTKLVAAVLALAVLAVIAFWLSPWEAMRDPDPLEQQASTTQDRPSVAVLPFANLSDDESQEYFADGLTDDLIIDLAKVSGLFVIARNSVFTFKGSPVRIQEVAEELGVRYVVEGSVRRVGERVRVNAQLVDGRTGHHLWGERYDREITDLFAVQDELVGQIVGALSVQLTHTEASQLASRSEPEFRAYDLYLQARDGYYSRDQARMRESFDLYSRATTIDPQFARAYAGLAQLSADVWRLNSLREVMAGAVARKVAEEAATKALDLDPTLADAHSVLALLRLVEREHEAALTFARLAVRLEPSSADAHTTLAIVLGYAGQPGAALESIQAAMRLNPRPPPYLTTYYGWVLFLNRRYDDAIAVLEPIATTRDRGIADAPREILAMAYAESGRLEKAKAQVGLLREREPFLNLMWYRSIYDYHAREEDLRHRLDALAKAGMPQWPLAFEGDSRYRLMEPDLERLISDTTWTGSDAGRKLSFIQEFQRDGGTVYAAATTILSGEAFVRGDDLCERFEGFILSRPACGPVYRNPEGTSADGNEYAYANPVTVKYFTLSR